MRIEPAFTQKIVEYLNKTGDFIVGYEKTSATRNLYSPEIWHAIDYPKIKVRIRSKKTKRAFDLNLKYLLKIEELKDKLELDRLSPNAKFVKKVTK